VAETTLSIIKDETKPPEDMSALHNVDYKLNGLEGGLLGL